jgi:hypothetical protein
MSASYHEGKKETYICSEVDWPILISTRSADGLVEDVSKHRFVVEDLLGLFG